MIMNDDDERDNAVDMTYCSSEKRDNRSYAKKAKKDKGKQEKDTHKKEEKKEEHIINYPEITGLSPNEGPECGGTHLTIRGENLGLDADDITKITVSGVDCISSLEWVSSNKLFVVTSPGRGSGVVVIKTKTGGKGVSEINFTFEKPEKSLEPPGNGESDLERSWKSFRFLAHEKSAALKTKVEKITKKKDTQVFEVPLEDAVCRSRLAPNHGLPAVVLRCIEYLENYLDEEGIYRLSGSMARIRDLKVLYDKGKDVDLSQENDPNVVSGLLKLWFRELPEPILTHELADEFAAVLVLNGADRDDCLNSLFLRLPVYNLCILRWLFLHLQHVAMNSAVNKMLETNLTIVFYPTLLIPQDLLNYLLMNAATVIPDFSKGFDPVVMAIEDPIISQETSSSAALPASDLSVPPLDHSDSEIARLSVNELHALHDALEYQYDTLKEVFSQVTFQINEEKLRITDLENEYCEEVNLDMSSLSNKSRAFLENELSTLEGSTSEQESIFLGLWKTLAAENAAWVNATTEWRTLLRDSAHNV